MASSLLIYLTVIVIVCLHCIDGQSNVFYDVKNFDQRFTGNHDSIANYDRTNQQDQKNNIAQLNNNNNNDQRSAGSSYSDRNIFGQQSDQRNSNFGQQSDQRNSNFGQQSDQRNSNFGQQSDQRNSNYGQQGSNNYGQQGSSNYGQDRSSNYGQQRSSNYGQQDQRGTGGNYRQGDQRSSNIAQYNTEQRGTNYDVRSAYNPRDQRGSYGQQYSTEQRSTYYGNNDRSNPYGQYGNDQRNSYGQYNYEQSHGHNPGGSNTDGYYYNTRIRGGVGAGGVGGRFYGNPSDDREKYHLSTPFPQPGVLAGWRPDLQGRQRPDSINLDHTPVYVTTSYGQIQGFRVYLYDNPDPKSYFRPGQTPVERVQGNCSVFLGIPYAMPPIREGRFKPPRAHRGWQLLQAVDFGPACPQPVQYTGATKGIRDVDEDCLYLNVYSPNVMSGLASLYPVMVHIHGGDFQHGASNLFPAHMLATFYDVIVVTINYRLGALGFLSTGDENSPGNYGLLDQAMAISWIYENIQFFNGDRKLITLFGPGAGAASAGLLMVAPRTSELITRVIAQSGSALADWAIFEDVYRVQNTSRVFAHLLGCSIESSWKIVNCLKQGRNFYELGNANFQPDIGTFPWAPVIDVNFTVPGDDWYEGWRERDWHMFNEMPETLIKQGKFNRGISYLSGVTHDEAAYFIYNNDSLAPHYEIDEAFFDQKAKEFVLKYNYTLNPEGIYHAIKYMYTYWPDPKNNTLIREQYINWLSDFFYRAPSDKMAKLLVEQGVPVYLYHLNTSVEALQAPYWRRVPHNTEYYFLTGSPFMDHEFFPKKLRLERAQWTDNDRNMSHFFMKAFSNFARYGNPSHTAILGLHFEMARAGELKYLNLNTTYNSSVMLNYRQTECAFWTEYLPTVIGRLVPTYPPTTEFWWEPNEPLQIAFWSVSGMCLLLIVVVFICCMLWRNAKRDSKHYYSGDLILQDTDINHENAYEFRNAPQSEPAESKPVPQAATRHSANIQTHPMPPATTHSQPTKAASTPSLRSGSANSLRGAGDATSLKDGNMYYSKTSLSSHPAATKYPKHNKNLLHDQVPQTQV